MARKRLRRLPHQVTRVKQDPPVLSLVCEGREKEAGFRTKIRSANSVFPTPGASDRHTDRGPGSLAA